MGNGLTLFCVITNELLTRGTTYVGFLGNFRVSLGLTVFFSAEKLYTQYQDVVQVKRHIRYDLSGTGIL